VLDVACCLSHVACCVLVADFCFVPACAAGLPHAISRFAARGMPQGLMCSAVRTRAQNSPLLTILRIAVRRVRSNDSCSLAAHTCTGTGLAPAHICAGTGLLLPTSAPGVGVQALTPADADAARRASSAALARAPRNPSQANADYCQRIRGGRAGGRLHAINQTMRADGRSRSADRRRPPACGACRSACSRSSARARAPPLPPAGVFYWLRCLFAHLGGVGLGCVSPCATGEYSRFLWAERRDSAREMLLDLRVRLARQARPWPTLLPARAFLPIQSAAVRLPSGPQ
jgi:hypothetical protein